MSNAPHLKRVFEILEKANAYQLAGDNRMATYWHWQLVKLAKSAKDVRVKAAALASTAYYHGFISYQKHEYGKAETLFKRALQLGIREHYAFVNCGAAIRDQGRIEEAIAFFQKAVEVAPDAMDALIGLGNLSYELGNQDAASIAWARALTIDTNDPAAEYSQSLLALHLGDYRSHWWRKHHRRWAAPLFRAAQDAPPTPAWDGEATQQRVLFFAEQGMGDALMLLRWLPTVLPLTPDAVLAVHAPLVTFCRHNWPELEVVALEDPVRHDLHCSLYDLPMLCGVERTTDVPNGAFLRGRRVGVGNPAGPPPSIGLCFAGGKGTHHDWRRSMRWGDMRPLTEVADVSFIVMQKERLDEIPKDDLPRLFLADREGDGLKDWLATADWLEGLDLLITVDTGIGHLAGCLGLPTWLCIPRFPDYRWGFRGEETHWYPWHRLFRQDVAQDWAGVIARVRDELGLFIRHGSLIAEAP